MWFEDPSTYPDTTDWGERGYACREPQAGEVYRSDQVFCSAYEDRDTADNYPYKSGFACCLAEGHDGPHVAFMDEDQVIGKWAEQPPCRPGNWEIEE